jgi:hypothetical protein
MQRRSIAPAFGSWFVFDMLLVAFVTVRHMSNARGTSRDRSMEKGSRCWSLAASMTES